VIVAADAANPTHHHDAGGHPCGCIVEDNVDATVLKAFN
jgi:hypothetical protein